MSQPPASDPREARRRAILESAVREFADHGFLFTGKDDLLESGGAEGAVRPDPDVPLAAR